MDLVDNNNTILLSISKSICIYLKNVKWKKIYLYFGL